MRFIVVIALAGALAGCAQEIPKCNAPETIKTVQEIFLEQLLPAEYKSIAAELFNSKTKIELAAPTKYDKDIKKLECSGTFVVDASAGVDEQGRNTLTNPKRLQEFGFSSQLDSLSAQVKEGRFAFNLTYSSQDVDGRHIVAIQGVDPLRAFLVGAYVAGHQQPINQKPTPIEEKHEAVIIETKPNEVIALAEAPKCSAPEVVDLLKETFAERVISAAEMQLAMRQSLTSATTPEKFQEKKPELLASLGIQEIFSNSYNAEAKKRICDTHIFANAAPNFKIPVRYVVQLPEDSSKVTVTPVFDMPKGVMGFNLLISLRKLLVEAMSEEPKEAPKDESSTSAASSS